MDMKTTAGRQRGISMFGFVWIAAGLVIVIVQLWQPIEGDLWNVTGAGMIVLYAVSLLGWLTVPFTSFLTDHFELFGLRQVFEYALERPRSKPEFRERALYKKVRHPMMLPPLNPRLTQVPVPRSVPSHCSGSWRTPLPHASGTRHPLVSMSQVLEQASTKSDMQFRVHAIADEADEEPFLTALQAANPLDEADPATDQERMLHFMSHVDAECFISLLQVTDPHLFEST